MTAHSANGRVGEVTPMNRVTRLDVVAQPLYTRGTALFLGCLGFVDQTPSGVVHPVLHLIHAG